MDMSPEFYHSHIGDRGTVLPARRPPVYVPDFNLKSVLANSAS
jgi:hypothetical protein